LIIDLEIILNPILVIENHKGKRNNMAKKSMIEREKKRIKLTNKYAKKREILLKEFHETNDFSLKLEIHSKLQKLPRNSSKIRIRNRCWKTGRPRGYYRDFGLSRHVLREMAHQCLLPGVTKSSW
jgi:small subunit ribosomal protein S14